MFERREEESKVSLFYFGAYCINESVASDVFAEQVDGGMRETELTLRAG